MTGQDLSKHRPNVGVVLFHRDGRVWYGRRVGSANPRPWQFPQGGVDEGEDFEAAARRELEDLRAAIRHHWEDGLCSALTPVVLPDKGSPRQRWLTRKEAARLLWAAWRLRQKWRGRPSDRATAKHFGKDRRQIYRWLESFGIPREPEAD